MPAVVGIPSKIALLIPRLASESDAEVVASVRAIQRQLATVGLDLHDLARAIPTVVLSSSAGPAPSGSASSGSAHSGSAYSGRRKSATPGSFLDIATWIMTQPGSIERFNDFERTFIRDIYHGLLDGMRPSRKQARLLLKCYYKIHGPWVPWADSYR